MKILLELWTGIGPLIRSLPIADVLQKRGHEIQFISHDQSAKYMKACKFNQAGLDIRKVVIPRIQISNWRSIDTLVDHSWFTEPGWLESTQKVWRDFLQKEQFDLIVSDFGLQSSLAARCLGIPLVTITQSCMHPRRKGGRIWYWDKEQASDYQKSACKQINRYLEQFQVPTLNSVEDLYLSDKTIIPGIPEFDWLEESSIKNTYYTGPILWEGLYQGKNAEHLPFVPTSSKKTLTVFAYTGRMQDSSGDGGKLILEALLDAAHRRGQYQFLISTGGMDIEAKELANKMPSNVRIVNWVPVATAFSLADLVIHHGGHGSCMANILYGKPALILPTHTERNFNAHRMSDLQCGNFISELSISGESIVREIELIMDDRRYLNNIQAYQQEVKTNYKNSAAFAADLIEL